MRPALVGDWLGRRALLSPSAPAIIDLAGARTLDYATLERETNQVAHWLLAQGVGRGDRVAILAKNRIEFLELWFACGKLGAVVQALNWRLTATELAPLIRHATPRLLCWDHELASLVDQLRTLCPELACVGLDEPAFARFRSLPSSTPPRPEPALGPDDAWVLCYTGGTTGLPKAAILTHGNIAWNAINTASSWGLSATDVAVLNAPMFHTGGLNVFTAPLIHIGGCSILCREFQLDQFFDLIEQRGVTCFFGVPAMFVAMQAHPRWASAPLERLKIIISGGAPCPLPVFERFWARGVAFRTGYGLTEAGPNNFWLPAELAQRKPGAVGWPLMHVDIRIVDANGHDCRTGEIGELWIRGPHVSPGYDRDPDASAASFIDGWLHTGDLAHSDAEGCVTIVGRSKDMIISGGENIYPAEIESVIAAHPDVVEAALVGIPDERWGEVGRAFVVVRAGACLDEAALQAFLRPRLAKYKLPKAIVFVEALPRTGPGKIDKRALARLG